MYELIVENSLGNRLNLATANEYTILQIDGLNPPTATINTSAVGGMDGEKFNSAKVAMRNMLFQIKINGDVETNRIALYQFFRGKEKLKIYYKNGKKNVFIHGIVESVEIAFFENPQVAQVSILCPQPFFLDAQQMISDLSKVVDQFTFPFSIPEEGMVIGSIESTLTQNVRNEGETTCGVTMEITALGNVVNPVIYHVGSRKHFGLNIELKRGDLVTVNTGRGEKKVTLLRESVETDLHNLVKEHSTWFQLDVGDNLFTYECDEGEEYFKMRLKYRNQYQGV